MVSIVTFLRYWPKNFVSNIIYAYVRVKHFLPASYNLHFLFTGLNRTYLELGQVFLISEREEIKFFWKGFTCLSFPKAPHTLSKFSSLYFIKGEMNHLQRLSKTFRNTKAIVCLIRMKTICCKCLLKIREII